MGSIGVQYLPHRAAVAIDLPVSGGRVETVAIPLGQFLNALDLSSPELREKWQVWSDCNGGRFDLKKWKHGPRKAQPAPEND